MAFTGRHELIGWKIRKIAQSAHAPEKNRYKNSFILKYKLDYCASGVHDGGREGERSRPNVRGGVANELKQKMLAKRGKKENTK